MEAAKAPETQYAAPTAEPAEILDELIARGAQRIDDTLAGLSMADFQATLLQHRERVEASFKLTYPEDWVLYKTQDDKLLGYLQADGCERIAPLWEIQFGKLDLRGDVIEERVKQGTEEEHVAYTVQVSGACRVTGATADEFGFRSTQDGLFAKQWLQALNEPMTRLRLLANVRKSAVENAKGRLVRSFTGMATVPVDELVRFGLEQKRMRGVTFERGTHGGAGGGASEPQLKRLAGLACHEGKVAKLGKGDYGNTIKRLMTQCTLSKGAASALMDRLQQASEPISNVDFWKAAGYTAPAQEKAPVPSGNAPAVSGSTDSPPSDPQETPVLDEKGVCRTCERKVSEFGHTKSCPHNEGPA